MNKQVFTIVECTSEWTNKTEQTSIDVYVQGLQYTEAYVQDVLHWTKRVYIQDNKWYKMISVRKVFNNEQNKYIRKVLNTEQTSILKSCLILNKQIYIQGIKHSTNKYMQGVLINEQKSIFARFRIYWINMYKYKISNGQTCSCTRYLTLKIQCIYNTDQTSIFKVLSCECKRKN